MKLVIQYWSRPNRLQSMCNCIGLSLLKLKICFDKYSILCYGTTKSTYTIWSITYRKKIGACDNEIIGRNGIVMWSSIVITNCCCLEWLYGCRIWWHPSWSIFPHLFFTPPFLPFFLVNEHIPVHNNVLTATSNKSLIPLMACSKERELWIF